MANSLPGISLVPGTYVIHRLAPPAGLPEIAHSEQFLAFVKTRDEISIVCRTGVEIASERRETGWSLLKIAGPLEFSLIGILANISTVLASSGISIFVVSTFDTDYILVKEKRLQQALQALDRAGYRIVRA